MHSEGYGSCFYEQVVCVVMVFPTFLVTVLQLDLPKPEIQRYCKHCNAHNSNNDNNNNNINSNNNK